MKLRYDLHIHSALSPCADDEMTPCNIAGFAALDGIDIIAVSDHNAIGNVKSVMAAGMAYGVTVVPAMELQTAEDIHILCLFPCYEDLEGFYNSIKFPFVENRPDIFGNQLLMDEDDCVVGTEQRLLLNSSLISSSEVKALADGFNGVAVPAHIDRDENGMIAILGAVTDEFTAVELSARASDSMFSQYMSKYSGKVLVDSDAHTLSDIRGKGIIDLPSASAADLIAFLKK